MQQALTQQVALLLSCLTVSSTQGAGASAIAACGGGSSDWGGTLLEVRLSTTVQAAVTASKHGLMSMRSCCTLHHPMALVINNTPRPSVLTGTKPSALARFHSLRYMKFEVLSSLQLTYLGLKVPWLCVQPHAPVSVIASLHRWSAMVRHKAAIPTKVGRLSPDMGMHTD